MFRRMGELLVAYGELDEATLREILDEQRRHYRPFGRIAAEKFTIDEWAIWRAWAQQYAACCPSIDLSGQLFDPAVASLVTPDEIWTFRVLPLRYHDGDAVLVTARPFLARALAFIDIRLNDPAVLWLAPVEQLESTILSRHGHSMTRDLLTGRPATASKTDRTAIPA